MQVNRAAFFALSLILAGSIYAENVIPRSRASCGFLLDSIYCIGGSVQSAFNIAESPDNSINILNLTALNGTSTSDLQNKWTPVTPIYAGFDTTARNEPQHMALPDGKRMVFNGGFTGSRSVLQDQSIVYNASTNLWSKYSNYSEHPFGSRQISQATSVYVPGLGVGFYGGLETNYNPNWTIPTRQNFSKAIFDESTRLIGFTHLTFFNIDNMTEPWSTPTPQNNVPRTYSTDLTSIYDPASQNIYFFGGKVIDIDGPANERFIVKERPLSYSLYYNIRTNTWGNQSWEGPAPSYCRYHTTTLLPSTNRDILLYGGGEDSPPDTKVAADYCYVLNLGSKKWTQVDINAPGAVLARTMHSAVMVGNETLFIVFGKDTASIATSSVVVLNVTNPNKIVYIDKYFSPMDQDALSGVNLTELPNVGPIKPGGLSSGAIAGIAVGSVIAGLLLVGTYVFFMCKKRRKQKKLEEHKPESMEVDWDAIENKYEETSQAKYAGQWPVVNTEGSSTVRNSKDIAVGPIRKAAMNMPVNVPTNVSVNVPDGASVNVPDGVSANLPDITTWNHRRNVYQPQLLIKPDSSDF